MTRSFQFSGEKKPETRANDHGRVTFAIRIAALNCRKLFFLFSFLVHPTRHSLFSCVTLFLLHIKHNGWIVHLADASIVLCHSLFIITNACGNEMLDVCVSILLSVSLRNRFQIFLFSFFFIPHCLRPVANISVFACVCFVSNVGTTVATDEAIFIHLPWTVVSATVSESRVTLTTLACAWIVIVASIAVSCNTELNNQPTL